MWWQWVLWIVGGLVGLIALFMLVAYLVGVRQPMAHDVTRRLRLRQRPQEVWEVLADHAGEPAWYHRVSRVERLPDRDGHETWRLHFKGAGNPPCVLETLEKAPPTRLVRSIVDEKKVFFGRWDFDVAPTDGGSIVTLTEHGEIPSPLFRGMFRLFANPARYVEMYLKSLAAKFGETADVTA